MQVIHAFSDSPICYNITYNCGGGTISSVLIEVRMQ